MAKKHKRKVIVPTIKNAIRYEKIAKAATTVGISCFVASLSLLFFGAAREVVDTQAYCIVAGGVASGIAGAVASEVARVAKNEAYNIYKVVQDRQMWKRRKEECNNTKKIPPNGNPKKHDVYDYDNDNDNNDKEM